MDKQYFQRLNQLMKSHKRAIPSLIIDLDRLDHNIQLLQSRLAGKIDFRLVVKSLPAPALIQYILQKTSSNKLMVFHQPFLSGLANTLDRDADVLLGKPMPIKTAAYFYTQLPKNHSFDPSTQIQWLIDTPERLDQYLALAKKLQGKIGINLELDVGLRRGGFGRIDRLRGALTNIEQNTQWLQFKGFMGYDPHVVKLPRLIKSAQKAFRQVSDQYQQAIDLLKNEFPALWKPNLCLNGGGSPTLTWHSDESSIINDLALGSALLKPSTFDIPELADFQPACFIATPILKRFEGTSIPGLEKQKSLLSRFKASFRQSAFIYGGYWKADYCYPPGTHENAIFGASTNQSMINIPPAYNMEVDDFVFLRPQQSEFVLLQFGPILAIRDQEIVAEWMPFVQH